MVYDQGEFGPPDRNARLEPSQESDDAHDVLHMASGPSTVHSPWHNLHRGFSPISMEQHDAARQAHEFPIILWGIGWLVAIAKVEARKSIQVATLAV